MPMTINKPGDSGIRHGVSLDGVRSSEDLDKGKAAVAGTLSVICSLARDFETLTSGNSISSSYNYTLDFGPYHKL